MRKTVGKAILPIALVLAMVFCFTACSSAGEKVSGKTYDVGNFTVLVPDGWNEVTSADTFDEYDGDTNPNTISLVKGGSDSSDMFNYPSVNITYYDEDKQMADPSQLKDYYDDVEDIDDIKGGNYTWSGFTCTSIGYPLAILWTEKDGAQIQASVWTDMSKGSISLEDKDFLAILDSIKY